MTYRQVWAGRIQLEARCHAASLFFTLTYSPEFLPDPPQLEPDDLQKFLKRFRKAISPRRIRFFACGEYGSRSLRPHYHGVFFGIECNIDNANILKKAWSLGHVQVAELSPARASYVAKYVCKDVSADDKVPEGWQREFARMSNKPGIGALYVDRMAEKVNEVNLNQRSRGYPAVSELAGGSMRIGPVYYPTGRYVRDRLQKQIPDGQKSKLSKMLQAERKHSAERSERIANALNRDRQKLEAHKVRQKLKKSEGVL